MELNWSTFVLELLNFLVLVWILKRFLYKPVQDTIAKRKAKVDEVMSKAAAIETEAEALKLRYEHRLEEWEAEKTASRELLRQELAMERERALTALDGELEREREKDRVVESRQREDRLQKDRETCLQLGARFVSRLFSGLASPDLEARLLEQALMQMETLPAERLASLRSALQTAGEPVSVETAYSLNLEQREQLIRAVTELLDVAPDCRFAEDPALLAGLRIEAGPWVLQANLADELKSFVESAHERA